VIIRLPHDGTFAAEYRASRRYRSTSAAAQQQWRPSTVHSSKLRSAANARSVTLDSQCINQCEMGYVFFN